MTDRGRSVYVLTMHWDYEGETIYGTFSTRALAEEARRKLEADPHPPGDSRPTYVVELDAEPKDFFARWPEL